MSKLPPITIAFCLWLAVMMRPAVAQVANDPCSSCHRDLSAVLPKDHPQTPAIARGLSGCLTCHSIGQVGEAVSNPFATRLHLVHIGEKKAPDCTSCHVAVPGKQFGLIGQSISWGTPKSDDLAAMNEIAASWATSKFTDHLHAKASVDCAGCHGKAVPRLDDTVENERCLTCHGPIEKLADKTRNPDFPNRNPHASHLGSDIACTVCHHAHQASVVYCNNCHRQWTIKIPGAAD